MKIRYNFVCLIMFMLLGLAACTSPDEHIDAQFKTLPQVDSTLLYEYGAAYSSATGDCGGRFQDRWYGTSMSAADVRKVFLDYISHNGWSIWPEEVVEIWSQEGKDGLYRMGMDVFSDPASISQQQADYKLPSSVLIDTTHYQTIYLLSMTYRSSYAAKKCFGH